MVLILSLTKCVTLCKTAASLGMQRGLSESHSYGGEVTAVTMQAERAPGASATEAGAKAVPAVPQASCCHLPPNLSGFLGQLIDWVPKRPMSKFQLVPYQLGA